MQALDSSLDIELEVNTTVPVTWSLSNYTNETSIVVGSGASEYNLTYVGEMGEDVVVDDGKDEDNEEDSEDASEESSGAFSLVPLSGALVLLLALYV